MSSNYLSGLGIPEIHIYDRDDGQQPKYLDQYRAVNNRKDRSIAFITGKREMENYLHPDAIKEVFAFDITFSSMDDVPELVAKIQHEQESDKPWDQLSNEKKEKKIKRAKARLNNEVASRMTYERLCEMDPEREMESWFQAVNALLTIEEVQEMIAPTKE